MKNKILQIINYPFLKKKLCKRVKIIKISKVLILALFSFLFIVLNPFQFIMSYSYHSLDHKPTLAQPANVLRIGITGTIKSGTWDPAITEGDNILEYYKKSCLEPLLWLPNDSLEPESQLATVWEYEYWPEGFINALGFNNSGGVKAINITLRNGVEFHDGSNWNATVAKWNIDRLFVITGNLTGNAKYLDMRNIYSFWVDVEAAKPYFTFSWNLSKYDADGVTFTPDQYAGYQIDDVTTLSNPNPYGGIDIISNSHIHYAPYDKYPIVRQVKILEELQSGGKIIVEFNYWNIFEKQDRLWTPQISMDTYKDYFERGVYGHENGVLDPINPAIVNHMIGTGPYMYEEYSESLNRGYLIKNENYWNKTALEAERWFGIDQVEIISFPPGELGTNARNIALLVHAIDYSFDTITSPLDYYAIMANPNINYTEYGFSEEISQITLNSINETWWSGGVLYPGEPWELNFSGVDISTWYPNEQGIPPANGIPRVLRKALSYAFNYDIYISSDKEGRVVRAGGIFGADNLYYNSSIPLPEFNLTKAREILLTAEDDPYSLTQPWWPINFTKLLADRGLDENSTSPVWQAVANVNPIFTINFYYDELHQDLRDRFEFTCNQLGVAIIQDADNKAPSGSNLWDWCVSEYWKKSFDGVHSIWSAQAWSIEYSMPKTNPEDWVEATYGDPSLGSWRTGGVTDDFPWWNLAFCYDMEIDSWLGRVKYGDQAEKVKWLGKIADKIQTELYPMIYIAQGKEGRVLWNDWEMNFNRGDLFFANFRKYIPPPTNPPGQFFLSAFAGSPDIDGNFSLFWSSSSEAQNYSLYTFNSLITEITDSADLLMKQNATSPISISGLLNGEYYYVVVAHNLLGDKMSNNVHVTVETPEEPTEFEISGYNPLILMGIAIFTVVILFKKKKVKL